MTTTAYSKEVGALLRAHRVGEGLSLNQVEERSGGVWKAPVVGTYERGDRQIAISKLADYAAWWRVHISTFIPGCVESVEPPPDLAEVLAFTDEAGWLWGKARAAIVRYGAAQSLRDAQVKPEVTP